MVKYYGRARQRTGSVNRNQTGVKQAGCVTGRGRPSWVSRYITRRVNCNARVGCVTAAGTLNGQLRVMQKWDLQTSCVANRGFQLIARAPRSRGCAGGVYMIGSPFICR